MTFADMVRRFRETAGLTQAGLAQKSGVSLRTIQGWEQGYRCPLSPDLFRLAKALGVRADDFSGCAEADGAKAPPPRPARARKRKGG
jgi:transcriptional regulator with XRE-family HTH domain